MSLRRWKWFFAAVLLVGVLLVFALLYRDSIGREIINKALQDSEYSVSKLSVRSLSDTEIRLSELVLERSDGSRVAVEGITLPVNLRERRIDTLDVEELRYTPGQGAGRGASYAELLQLGLTAHTRWPDAEVHIGRVLVPWVPEIRNAVWRTTGSGHSARFDLAAFAVSLGAQSADGDAYDVTAAVDTVEGSAALRFAGQAQPVDADMAVAGNAMVELEHWYPVLRAIGAVPADIRSLRGSIAPTVGIRLPWDTQQQVLVTPTLPAETVVAVDYGDEAGGLIRMSVATGSDAVIVFQYPALEWQVAAMQVEVHLAEPELDLRLRDVDCASGIRCELVAEHVASELSGDDWSVASLRVSAPLGIELIDELRVVNTAPVSLRARRVTVAGEILPEVLFTGDARYERSIASVDLALEALGAAARVVARHDAAAGTGELRVSDAALDFGARNASDIPMSWDRAWDVLAGELRLAAIAEWQIADDEVRYAWSASTILADLSGNYTDLAFGGLNAEIDLRGDAGGQLSVAPFDIGIALFDAGLTVQDIRATLAPDFDSLTVSVSNVGMRLLGGSIGAEPFVYALEAASNRLTLLPREIQLQLMVDAAKSSGIVIEGGVSGRLPVTLTAAGVTIEGGSLESDAPGGAIRYRPVIADSGDEDSQLAIVTRALSNFEFDELTSDVVYTEEGDLLMQMRMTGINPDLDPNQPVVLNLGVENNVPQLLRSLRAGRTISDILGRKVAN